MAKIAKKLKINPCIGYVDRSKNRQVETMNKHSKQLTQKNIQERRIATHRKINCALQITKHLRKNTREDYKETKER